MKMIEKNEKEVITLLKNYVVDNERLYKEWDNTKNLPFTAETVKLKSGKNVWWKCENEHEWQARVVDRVNGNGCPYCSGKRTIIGVNDLRTLNPTIASEWNYEKNGELRPEQCCLHSGKRVWWQCKEGHEWQATIDSRTRVIANGCPYCAGQRVIKGKNDLATIAPELAEQWNYEKNGDLQPDKVCVNSGKKVWWKCEYGHEWCVSPNSRYSQKTGCKKCSSYLRTSYPEQVIFCYLKKIYQGACNRYKLDNGMELDVYIEEIKTGIEYDGIVYHSSKEAKEREIRKDIFCKEKEIRLIRVKEVKEIPFEQEAYCIYRKIGKGRTDLEVIIEEILNLINADKELINKRITIDIEKDTASILAQYMNIKKFQNISENIYAEWDYEKNGELKPDMINKYSHRKVWWKCQSGHSWQASMQHRTKEKKATGCPFCSNQKVLEGYNDFQSIYPELAKQWAHELNEKTPKDYTAKSYHKVWWKCEKGHVWEAAINKRVYGRGCPICAGKKVLVGYNDLETTCSTLALEWDYDKNIGCSPKDVTKGSNRVVWWKCKYGHSWEAMINKRVLQNAKCPYCAQSEEKYI